MASSFLSTTPNYVRIHPPLMHRLLAPVFHLLTQAPI